MKLEKVPKARIYVCINEKAPEKAQCLKGEGEKCVEWLKEELKSRHLSDQIWVVRTKCQKYCNPQGTSVAFEPCHRQYSGVKFEELPNLLNEFLELFESESLLNK